MRRVIPLIAALALLAAFAPPAVARDRSDCFRPLGRGTSVLMETRYGVVWQRDGRGGQVFACIYSQGRTRRLPNQTTDDFEFIVRSTISFDGRFVAYGAGTDEPAADEAPSFLVVYDVKSARRVQLEAAAPEGVNTNMHATVVKANGSVAWIGSNFNGGEAFVQKIDADGQAVLDRGTDIGTTSLAKARDERTIYWTRGGEPRSMRLR